MTISPDMTTEKVITDGTPLGVKFGCIRAMISATLMIIKIKVVAFSK
jgi:hypothetical protein